MKNRIKELRMVKGAQIIADPDNWRVHSDAQREGMLSILDEVGFAGAVLVREDEDGKLHAVDGHLRSELLPDEELPVLVTDLTEEEAKIVLATYDPLSSMAETDTDLLAALMEEIRGKDLNHDLSMLLEDVADTQGISLLELEEQEEGAHYLPIDNLPEGSTVLSRKPAGEVIPLTVHVPKEQAEIIERWKEYAEETEGDLNDLLVDWIGSGPEAD